jgi:hypothetical protein
MWNASIDADGVVACLEHLAERGAPAYVRFDHGPEFIAYAVADWCRFNGTDTVFIDPGSPWQNTWIESFNGRLRAKFLNRQQFATLLEDWRIDYNINRPHTAGSPPSSSSRLGSAGNSSHSHGEWINYRGPLSQADPKSHGSPHASKQAAGSLAPRPKTTFRSWPRQTPAMVVENPWWCPGPRHTKRTSRSGSSTTMPQQMTASFSCASRNRARLPPRTPCGRRAPPARSPSARPGRCCTASWARPQ